MENLIDLESLSEEEKNLILSVIRREEDLKKEQDHKITQLRIEIHNLRKQSILRGEDNSNKICIRCRKLFGFFFDTGDYCSHCKYKICNNCRETLVSGGWLCCLCYKQMQLKWMTGEWIYGTTKKCPTYALSGGEVVKASIRKATSSRNIARPDDNVDGGASSSPVSSTLDRITSPQESDKMRLSHLFSSFKPGKTEVPESEVSVQHISCRRRVDSDSESSEDEAPAEIPKAVSTHSSIKVLSEPGNSVSKQQASSETESMTNSPKIPNSPRAPNSPRIPNSARTPNSPRIPNSARNPNSPSMPNPARTPNSPRIPNKTIVGESGIPSIQENGHSLAVDDGCEYSTSYTPSEHQSSSLSNSTTTPSVKENGSSLKNEKEEQFLPMANVSQTPFNVLTPITESKVQPQSKPVVVQRTSSGKSDASSVSLTSTRTASPRTKMRLLDMASRRALERDSSDLDECGSHSSHNGSEVAGKPFADFVVEGSSKLTSLHLSKKSDSSFQGKRTSSESHQLEPWDSDDGQRGSVGRGIKEWEEKLSRKPPCALTSHSVSKSPSRHRSASPHSEVDSNRNWLAEDFVSDASCQISALQHHSESVNSKSDTDPITEHSPEFSAITTTTTAACTSVHATQVESQATKVKVRHKAHETISDDLAAQQQNEPAQFKQLVVDGEGDPFSTKIADMPDVVQQYFDADNELSDCLSIITEATEPDSDDVSYTFSDSTSTGTVYEGDLDKDFNEIYSNNLMYGQYLDSSLSLLAAPDDVTDPGNFVKKVHAQRKVKKSPKREHHVKDRSALDDQMKKKNEQEILITTDNAKIKDEIFVCEEVKKERIGQTYAELCVNNQSNNLTTDALDAEIQLTGKHDRSPEKDSDIIGNLEHSTKAKCDKEVVMVDESVTFKVDNSEDVTDIRKESTNAKTISAKRSEIGPNKDIGEKTVVKSAPGDVSGQEKNPVNDFVVNEKSHALKSDKVNTVKHNRSDTEDLRVLPGGAFEPMKQNTESNTLSAEFNNTAIDFDSNTLSSDACVDASAGSNTLSHAASNISDKIHPHSNKLIDPNTKADSQIHFNKSSPDHHNINAPLDSDSHAPALNSLASSVHNTTGLVDPDSSPRTDCSIESTAVDPPVSELLISSASPGSALAPTDQNHLVSMPAEAGHVHVSTASPRGSVEQEILTQDSSLAPHVKVSSEAGSDETGSHGGDSGHISGTSAENTPEHKSRSPRHLSIPSLVCTSADEKSHEEDEDEDIDELVSTLHNRNTLRSHLTDSRESLYSIYSDAGEINYGKIPVTGEILFGLDYNYKTGALEIYIKQCKDLAPVDTKRNRSDPYVKTYLLPDKTRSGKRKTKIKKHTLNPTFDEVIRYVISKSEVENRVLWVTVWHNDPFGRNDFLGEVMISLECYKFGDSAPRWYLLQERLELPESSLCYKGDLVLSMKYVTPDSIESPTKKGRSKKIRDASRGELHVFVKESRNLTAVRSNGTSDPFCKGYLLPEKNKSVKQKTPVVKRNCNPEWNHIFLFDNISMEELANRSLELTVWDYDRITSNDFLGGVRLNLGTGQCNGVPVEWMDAHGQEVYVWKSTLERPNTWVTATVGLRHTMGRSEIKK